MSARVQGWVWELDVAPQAKVLLLWLANRATDAGVCFPTKRELGKRTGLSERMVRYHLEALARDRDDEGAPRQPIVSIIERRVAGDRNTSNVYVLRVPWADAETVRAELDELKYIPSAVLEGVGTTGCTQGGDDALHPVGTTGCTQVGTTGCTQNRSLREYHRNTPPYPQHGTAGRQQQRAHGEQTNEADGRQEPPHYVAQQPPREDQALPLVEAFYRGLGGDAGAVTATLRRRDLAIGRELVLAGATPQEAEAYARETSQTSGRVAPVDLRSFERERLGWLARHRSAQQATSRYVDRTGQPPSWQVSQSDPPVDCRPSPSAARAPSASARPSAAQTGGNARLAETLRLVLFGPTA